MSKMEQKIHNMVYIDKLKDENETLRSVIKAFVIKNGGEMVVEDDDLSEAELEALDLTRGEGGKFYFRVYS